MHNSPAQAYREADKGNTVVINHDRYPEKVFELTARERNPLKLSPSKVFLEHMEKFDQIILDGSLSKSANHFVDGHCKGAIWKDPQKIMNTLSTDLDKE